MSHSRVLAVFALLLAPATAAAQIPEGPGAGDAPTLIGEVWTPAPIRSEDPPRHPHMAPNARSNLHVDAYQTDVHQGPGPLGRGTTRRSVFFAAECASITFDSRGRIVTTCVGLRDVTLRLMDPATLETISSLPLPPRPASLNPFQNFTGGGYFYLDDRDRAVISTANRHVWVVKQENDSLVLERDYDVTAVVAGGDALISALPDWSGLIWFASRDGVVGTIDAPSGAVKAVRLEPIGNSFAIDSDGSVSIVTDAALYRLAAGGDGTPVTVWREEYPNDGTIKPGQTQAGSGTTPTLIGGDRVAITDNADPVHVMVFQRGATARGERLLCRVPVFAQGASSTDNSLIATPDFIVVENNYGYTGPLATQDGRSTAPGIARVDLDPSGRGCRVAWTSPERSPTVVPKLSTANGLVYVYTKDPRDDGEDYWYLTGIDARTGRTAFKALSGEGLGHNNNYAPVTLGPDGTAYVGVLGGMVSLRDSEAPPPYVSAPGDARLRCSGRRAAVTGDGVLRVVFRWRRRAVADERAPFATRVRGRRVRASVRVEGSDRLLRRAARCRSR